MDALEIFIFFSIVPLVSGLVRRYGRRRWLVVSSLMISSMIGIVLYHLSAQHLLNAIKYSLYPVMAGMALWLPGKSR